MKIQSIILGSLFLATNIAMASTCPSNDQVRGAINQKQDISSDGLTYRLSCSPSNPHPLSENEHIRFGGTIVNNSSHIIDCSYGIFKGENKSPSQVCGLIATLEKGTKGHISSPNWSSFQSELRCGPVNKGTFDGNQADCEFIIK